jgi:DNA-binding Lrp family transcriptional regulator
MTMDSILEILRENARTPNEQIAKRLGRTPEEVERQITQLEREKVILGYQAIVHPKNAKTTWSRGSSRSKSPRNEAPASIPLLSAFTNSRK